MSNPNVNNNINSTSLDNAYKFHSFSSYINTYLNNYELSSRFSPVCIFCSSRETQSVMNDGSFRLCNRCNKVFKPQFLR